VANAEVISLAAHRLERAEASGAPSPPVTRVTGLAVVLEAQPGAVCIVVGETELWLAPAEARVLVRDLAEFADYAEAASRG